MSSRLRKVLKWTGISLWVIFLLGTGLWVIFAFAYGWRMAKAQPHEDVSFFVWF